MLGFLRRLKKRLWIDSNTREFIEFNKAKWDWDGRSSKGSVILVDLFDMNPVIYCFSHIANYLAERTGSSIEAFHLARSRLAKAGIGERRLKKIFESFGAQLKLDLSDKRERPHRTKAREFADKAFSKLKKKEDVLALAIDGLKVGDLIYDSYLRSGHATVDLRDPVLKRLIYDAFMTSQVCKDYFDSKRVRAVLTSHAVYVSHGILVRMAIRRDVPVYCLLNFDALLITELRPDTYYPLKYPEYRDMFAKLPEAEKPAYRAEAQRILYERFDGKVDSGIADNILEPGRPGLMGYGPLSEKRLLKETGRPRILVMLNCFLDAPHCYRHLLFPDFWEWICFVLERASQTPFDWYVKPHPAGLIQNDKILEDLRVKFPKIGFLHRAASNRQLFNEGVNAMFTTFGTAAHEFAYMGIPVVTAGDNPQISYDFNFHPKTVEEYERYIWNAGNLKLGINREHVEEFFYMHYIHSYKKNEFDARCIDEDYAWLKLGQMVNCSSIFGAYISGESPQKHEKMKRLKTYFDRYFSKSFSDTAVP